MIALALFILLALIVVVLIEMRERKRQQSAQKGEQTPSAAARPDGCCGEHLVCEKETLLSTNAKIEYYDDEELDQYAGRADDSYTDAEIIDFNEVFSSLQEEEVAGWCRSLQMRNISLPLSVREEALLIIRERRNAA